MRRTWLALLLSLSGMIPMIAVASGPIFNLVPQVKHISISPSGQAFVLFTVTNKTSGILKNMTIDPANGLPNSAKSGISLRNNNCLSNLPKNASCTFQIKIKDNHHFPDTFQLSPMVCAYNHTACSQATAANRVRVSVLNEINIAVGEDFADLSGTSPPLLVYSSDQGSTWQKINPTTTDILTPGFFTASSCIGAYCMAAGYATTGPQPLIIIRQSGNTWTKVALDFITSGTLNAASCSSNFCIAAGQDLSDGSGLILLGKTTWSRVDLSSLVGVGSFNATTCTSKICIAAGQRLSGTSPPLIVVRHNSGIWSDADLSAFTDNGVFFSASCSGESNNLCVVVGQELTGAQAPLIAVSNNNGEAWTNVDISSIIANGNLRSVNCIKNTCIAVGQDLGGSQPPLILRSQNNGITWARTTIPFLTTNGAFTTIHCTQTVCVAVGQDFTGTTPPLMVVSNNLGSTWQIVDLTSFTDNAILNTVTCSQNFCMSAGEDFNTTQPPLILTSNDDGATWFKADLSQLSTSGVFYGGALSFGLKRYLTSIMDKKP